MATWYAAAVWLTMGVRCCRAPLAVPGSMSGCASPCIAMGATIRGIAAWYPASKRDAGVTCCGRPCSHTCCCWDARPSVPRMLQEVSTLETSTMIRGRMRYWLYAARLSHTLCCVSAPEA
jgi:hypothetical protein